MSYIVITKNDKGEYSLATRSLFADRRDAEDYARDSYGPEHGALAVGVGASEVPLMVPAGALSTTLAVATIFCFVPAKPRCSACGTTENLHRDRGSGGPFRCDSNDCLVF